MGRDVLVVIGVGGMGRAIARRRGAGRPLLLADAGADLLVDGGAVAAVTSQR